MGIFENLFYGFQVVLTPMNLAFCFVGVLIGTLVGVLPGVGPSTAVALLLPVTYKLSPVPAIVMLAGILYGAMYGGSTTSILLNVPGEAASVMTCLDGYKMALKGRAGPALTISAVGSFIAGTASVIILTIFAPVIANVALKLSAPEYFSIMFLGLVILVYLARGSLIKALIMMFLGLFLSQIGMDPVTGQFRFTFGTIRLTDGIEMVPIMMGIFGITDILLNLEKETKREVLQTKIKDLFLSLEEWRRSFGPIWRGTFVGFFLGLVPGAAGVASTIVSYALEKKISKTPEKFGTGMIEGVAGPESANNSAATGQYIPLLTLGIPSTPLTALLFAALLIHGIQPSPFLISQRPDLFWGVICSMYVGNVMLLVLNLPLVSLWVQVLRVPYKVLFPLILLFCLIGSYSLNNSIFDVLQVIIFGILGYVCKKMGFDTIPLVMSFVLGKFMEVNFRQALAIDFGNFLIFLYRPVSAICLGIAAFFLVTAILSSKKPRPSLLDED